eukprot:GEMP01007300.1.p1 GENE.GEMP01007300.1~~GEMP01007300.1.p1  ORF type:complete len:1145 (+),score=295.75 GEMP01007300.1:68-3502(+)
MQRLQELSLISKVTTEIKNHWGFEDKTLAEFIVELCRSSTSNEAFRKDLEENGAKCEPSFANHLYELIGAMTLGKTKRPRDSAGLTSTSGNSAPSRPKTEREEKFPGLAIPDSDRKRPELNVGFDARPKGEMSDTLKKLLEAEMTPDERRKLERDQRKDQRRDRRRSRSRGRKDDKEEDVGVFKKNLPLETGSVYEGSVSRLMEFGAFVSIETADGRKEGLCHINEMKKSEGRLLRPEDCVKKKQKVYVKVLGIVGTKVNLSMRDIDQETGRNLKPKSTMKNREAKKTNVSTGHGEMTGLPLSLPASFRGKETERVKNKLSDYEMWEARQLRASGVLDLEEQLDFDANTGVLGNDDCEENYEVEIAEAEPIFLRGQTTRAGVQLSPIRIVKEPDGSLARSAAGATTAAKDRREARETMQQSLVDAIPKDMSRPWEDPKPDAGERTVAAALRGLGATTYEVPEWKKLYLGKSVTYGQRSSKPIKEQRETLPIFKLRNQLLQAIQENQVLIVIGETGSGKTTQMTQYMAEAGYCGNGRMIGCTQPRRVAAMSVAKRVAEEFGCRLGQEVGYAIRFEDQTSPETLIKYQTDGMLLREILQEPLLKRYSIVMLDEAHERTINTDVLFGLLKRAVKERPDLKLIVTSATLDAEKFSSYFFDSHIFTIPGRTFPVEILYSKEPEADYVEAALMTVLQIHLCEPKGDILIFLTGQEEIDTACQILHERMVKLEANNPPPLIILPVYAALPSEMQTMIFDPAPPGCRKCVVATNIAEASLTIDGIYFVVDPGMSKCKIYNNKTGMDSLVITPISQANARQRAGRAGRTGPGKCYRLYTEQAYRIEMLPTAVPEIQRTNLTSVVLTLKAMGINDMITFDWMDPPPVHTLINSLETLWTLGALDDEGLMSKLGKRMAEFPMEPSLSKMLLASVDYKCSDEIISVISMLSVQNVFYRPRDKQAIADQKKAQFHQAEGDHITLLEVYKGWARNRFSNAWCYENFVQSRALRRAQDVRKQLLTILDRYKIELKSCGTDYNKVRYCIVAGFFTNACRRDPQEGYRTLQDQNQVFIHPSSALHMKNPEWLVYHELVLTTREYLRECCTLDPQWLPELAPNLYQKADDNKISRRKNREKIEPLYNRFIEPNSWRLSRRRG